MEVRTLYTLLAVVEHRRFCEAARHVNLSPSGVSLQIKSLEKELGITLFNRRTRPPTLTHEGQAFVKRAREVVIAWERLSERLKEEASGGVLELGAVHTLISGVLPLALRQLHHRVPDLQIRLTSGLSNELEELLLRGSVDAVLVTEPPTLRPNLIWQPFCQEPLAVVAPREVKQETDAAILTNHPFIRFKRFASVGRLVDDELRRRGITVQAVMEVDTLEGILALVADGLGVSVLPVRQIEQPFHANVKAVPFGQPPVTRPLGVLQQNENARAHLVQQLLEQLRAVCSAPVVRAVSAPSSTPVAPE